MVNELWSIENKSSVGESQWFRAFDSQLIPFSFLSEEFARNYISVQRERGSTMLFRIVHQKRELLVDGHITTVRWIPENN